MAFPRQKRQFRLLYLLLATAALLGLVRAVDNHGHGDSVKEAEDPMPIDVVEDEKRRFGRVGGGEDFDGVLTLERVYEELQECPIVKHLNAQSGSSITPTEPSEHGATDISSFTHKLFSYLFPLGPAGNSLLATAYISGPPNFLLALVPPDIDPSRLSVMVAFAIGGLLGDTLLHLIPGSFLGGEEEGAAEMERVEFVLRNNKRNLLMGTMVMVGFAVFVAMDKALRVAGMGKGDGRGHSHSHSHGHAHGHGHSHGEGTGREKEEKGELRKRRGGEKTEGDSGHEIKDEGEDEKKVAKQEVKMSSYLNIIADFSHNITDGLAMSAAFYASPTIGATTMIGVFFHEIPHEVGDFALLVQSGFTKWQAMGAQFFTAIGAFLGTFIGIGIQWYASREGESGLASGVAWNGGIWGTGCGAGDLVLPFTAGTFLYVGFSAVPELLEVDESSGRAAEVRRSLLQL
ncbi:ZIP zinc transporter-domain-containing protein [Kalaharituber pfeilii]|nr:ZIP zinc transporter-domain-containing protein [Kalaharituber pfeilii]